jgi:hypothetical protein
MVGLHLEAPCGFLRDTNDVIGKKSIYLNTGTNNFLGGTNFINTLKCVYVRDDDSVDDSAW